MPSQYQQIAGVRFERDLLSRANRAAEELGHITAAVAEELWTLAMDGHRVTPTERHTLEHILGWECVLPEARTLLQERLLLEEKRQCRHRQTSSAGKETSSSSSGPAVPEFRLSAAQSRFVAEWFQCAREEARVAHRRADKALPAQSSRAVMYDAECLQKAHELSSHGSITLQGAEELCALTRGKPTDLHRFTLAHILLNFALTDEARALLSSKYTGLRRPEEVSSLPDEPRLSISDEGHQAPGVVSAMAQASPQKRCHTRMSIEEGLDVPFDQKEARSHPDALESPIKARRVQQVNSTADEACTHQMLALSDAGEPKPVDDTRTQQMLALYDVTEPNPASLVSSVCSGLQRFLPLPMRRSSAPQVHLPFGVGAFASNGSSRASPPGDLAETRAIRPKCEETDDTAPSADDSASQHDLAAHEINRILEVNFGSQILGKVSPEEQQREFRRIARLLHPDKGLVANDDPKAKLAWAMVQAALQWSRELQR